MRAYLFIVLFAICPVGSIACTELKPSGASYYDFLESIAPRIKSTLNKSGLSEPPSPLGLIQQTKAGVYSYLFQKFKKNSEKDFNAKLQMLDRFETFTSNYQVSCVKGDAYGMITLTGHTDPDSATYRLLEAVGKVDYSVQLRSYIAMARFFAVFLTANICFARSHATDFYFLNNQLKGLFGTNILHMYYMGTDVNFVKIPVDHGDPILSREIAYKDRKTKKHFINDSLRGKYTARATAEWSAISLLTTLREFEKKLRRNSEGRIIDIFHRTLPVYNELIDQIKALDNVEIPIPSIEQITDKLFENVVLLDELEAQIKKEETSASLLRKIHIEEYKKDNRQKVLQPYIEDLEKLFKKVSNNLPARLERNKEKEEQLRVSYGYIKGEPYTPDSAGYVDKNFSQKPIVEKFWSNAYDKFRAFLRRNDDDAEIPLTTADN